jgi:SAM-dependent methyltransferase
MSSSTATHQGREARRTRSFGQSGSTAVDRFGVYLSKRAIRRTVGGRRGLKVLDLGCGYHATLLHALLPRLARGVGVDVRVSDAARRGAKLTFVESTIEDALPTMPDQSFDLVLMISVLEHLHDPVAVLREARRVARPGGAVVVNVPTWLGKWFLEFSAFRLGTSTANEVDDHKMYYGPRELWPLLVRAGFRPREIRMWHHKFGLNLFATAGVGDGGPAV